MSSPTANRSPSTPNDRVPAARLDPELYPIHYQVETRRSDAMRAHVPNARIADFFDDARAVLHEAIVGPELFEDAEKFSLLLADLHMQFPGEVTFPGSLSIGIGVTAIGNSSIREAGAFFRDRTCLVIVDCVMVKVEDRRPVPFTPAERERAERYLIRP